MLAWAVSAAARLFSMVATAGSAGVGQIGAYLADTGFKSAGSICAMI
jgi:hypothetical protein